MTIKEVILVMEDGKVEVHFIFKVKRSTDIALGLSLNLSWKIERKYL